ncbi:hypothetical protein D3C86_1504610 [compost metagenome]
MFITCWRTPPVSSTRSFRNDSVSENDTPLMLTRPVTYGSAILPVVGAAGYGTVGAL